MRQCRGNILLIVLLVAAVAALGASSFWWWQRNQAIKSTAPLTWEECIKMPNARILQSYPGICIAPDGRKVTQPLSNDSVIGIQPTSCCPCPTKITKEQVGKDGWVIYEEGRDYSDQRPKTCGELACKPCEPLDQVPGDPRGNELKSLDKCIPNTEVGATKCYSLKTKEDCLKMTPDCRWSIALL